MPIRAKVAPALGRPCRWPDHHQVAALEPDREVSMSGELTTRTMYGEDLPRTDAWLRAKGIPHGIGEVRGNPALCPNCAPELLELFKMPLSLTMRRVIANALFACNPDASPKREALEIMLAIINQNPRRYYSELASYVLNELTRH